MNDHFFANHLHSLEIRKLNNIIDDQRSKIRALEAQVATLTAVKSRHEDLGPLTEMMIQSLGKFVLSEALNKQKS